MPEPAWISYVASIGAIITPILLAAFGVIGWRIRSQIERRIQLESQLRDDRMVIYQEILEPFVVMFMTDAAWKSDPKNKNRDKNEMGLRKALSLDYRRQAFRLVLFGSDGVVNAYNDLMQHFFQASGDPGGSGGEVVDAEKVKTMLQLIGRLLLEIRRSMGNETTKLDEWAMLEWFIQDASGYRSA